MKPNPSYSKCKNIVVPFLFPSLHSCRQRETPSPAQAAQGALLPWAMLCAGRNLGLTFWHLPPVTWHPARQGKTSQELRRRVMVWGKQRCRHGWERAHAFWYCVHPCSTVIKCNETTKGQLEGSVLNVLCYFA